MTVRVRFAPSPTGIPHVGNIRTALFNWLFARHEGGTFVLRVEDTDRSRLVEGALEAILDGLRWLGIDWDEGPEVGGPYGPYFQSQRLERYRQSASELIERGQAYECFCSPERLEAILDGLRWLGIDWDEGPEVGGPYEPYFQSQRVEHYRRAAAELIEGGHAYECFCSPERLEEVRAAQQRRKEPPRYDRRCRHLSEGEREQRRAEGTPPVVRFKTPLTGSTSFHDLIRGGVSFDHDTLDDFVLLKSDGFPTYHLASVVDDHLMEITHVMRGDEWISSTPRHVLLYGALGWEPPLFAHLPLILGKDKARLAKRHGAVSVQEYRDQGFLPEAMFNFLGLLGWSLDDRTTIISREQFIAHFTLDRIVKNPAVFDLEKLTWMNGVYIREMPPDRLAELLAERLETDLPTEVARPIDRAYVERIVPLVRERVKRLDEASEMTGFFFHDGELEYGTPELLGKAFARRPEVATRALRTAMERVSALPSWGSEALEGTLRALAEGLSLKTGDLFMLLRVAVTGRRVSPPLFQSMEVLGRERCLSRLESALRRLEGAGP